MNNLLERVAVAIEKAKIEWLAGKGTLIRRWTEEGYCAQAAISAICDEIDVDAFSKAVACFDAGCPQDKTLSYAGKLNLAVTIKAYLQHLNSTTEIKE